MRLTQYQVDAFAERPFEGNPAAVIPLEEWLPDELMQAIAAENNLSETAFFVPESHGYRIRWFTPTTEVSLCGHATLAAAFVLFDQLDYKKPIIAFNSLSGWLTVSRNGNRLVLDFPRADIEPCDLPMGLVDALGSEPLECLRAGEDYLVVYANADEVSRLIPEFRALKQLESRGVIVTAEAVQHDFVCRFFAPGCGIDEDPVTGSAYTALAPYWARRLAKIELCARQVSSRGGEVGCRLTDDRVLISGHATLFMRGELLLDQV